MILLSLLSPPLAQADTVALTEDLPAWTAALRGYVERLPGAKAGLAPRLKDFEARLGFSLLEGEAPAGPAAFYSMKGAPVEAPVRPLPALSTALCPGEAPLRILFGLPGRPLKIGVEGCATLRIEGRVLSISTRHSSLGTGPLRLAFHRRPATGLLPRIGAVRSLLRLRLSAPGLGMLKVALGRDSPWAAWLEQSTGEIVLGTSEAGLRLLFGARAPERAHAALKSPAWLGALRVEEGALVAGKTSGEGADRPPDPVIVDFDPADPLVAPLMEQVPPTERALLEAFERVHVRMGTTEGRLWTEWRLTAPARSPAAEAPSPRPAPPR